MEMEIDRDRDREREGERKIRRCYCTAGFEDGERGHKPRNAGGL